MQEDRSLLVVALDSTFIAFRRSDGGVAWRRTFEDKAFIGTTKDIGTIEIVIHRGRVYAAFGRKLVCLDYATGAIVGETEIPAGPKRPVMLFDDEQLFLLGYEELLSFDLAGRPLWNVKHGLEPRSESPTLGFPGNVLRGDVMDLYR